jgi:hypothetical protein
MRCGYFWLTILQRVPAVRGLRRQFGPYQIGELALKAVRGERAAEATQCTQPPYFRPTGNRTFTAKFTVHFGAT